MDDFACRHDQCLSAMLWQGRSDPLPARPLPTFRLPVMPAPARPHAREPGHCRAPPTRRSEPGAASADRAPAAERERLIEAMERAGWVQAKAARILGLTPRQIGYALKKYDIEIKRF